MAVCTLKVVVIVPLPTILRVALWFILECMVVTRTPAAVRNGRHPLNLCRMIVLKILNLLSMASTALSTLLKVKNVLGRIMWCIIE